MTTVIDDIRSIVEADKCILPIEETTPTSTLTGDKITAILDGDLDSVSPGELAAFIAAYDKMVELAGADNHAS